VQSATLVGTHLVNKEKLLLPRVIIARDLDEAWYETLRTITMPEYCKEYPVQFGSFAGGQSRFQIESLTLVIEHPYTRPLAPQIPGGLSIEVPTTDEYIEKYFAEYIMNPELFGNNEYTYGQFIYPHLDGIIEMLINTPGTNQAVINIGNSLRTCISYINEEDWEEPMVYKDPPCMRIVDFKCYENKLNLHVYFRSWDIGAGMPTNLGGLTLLLEYVAGECGYEVGELVAYSSGAHIYDYYLPAVKARYKC
jgi:thymidylate synthase